MYNLQVYNFTNISTGFYDEIKLPISDNPIYKFGSIEAAMSDMTRWGIMNTVANSVGIFSPHTSNRMIICTGDISVKKAYGTLERINSFISDTSIARFTIPEINYYSHKNNFVHYGISLRIGIKDKEYEFVPCPMEMVKLLPNRFKDVIFAINPKDIGFDAGDFPGDIAFLINGEHDRRTKAHIAKSCRSAIFSLSASPGQLRLTGVNFPLCCVCIQTLAEKFTNICLIMSLFWRSSKAKASAQTL